MKKTMTSFVMAMVLFTSAVLGGEVYLGSQLDDSGIGGIGSTFGIYQNFTLNETYEITGGKIYFGNCYSSGALRVEIREIETNYTNMILTGTPLTTTNNLTAISGVDSNQFFEFTFNSPITLNEGEEYWVAFYSADGLAVNFGGTDGGVSWYWDLDYEYPTLWELTNGNDAYPDYASSETLYMAFTYSSGFGLGNRPYDADDFAPAVFDSIVYFILTVGAFAGLIVMVVLFSWGRDYIKKK